MNILNKITIKLSRDDLDKIISEHVEKSGYVLKKSIAEVEKTTLGYGMNEFDEYHFTGMTIDVERKEN